ncbi:hypothetical protein V496_02151 [Pseudogymnoascus sp. VKM F-4515 (FW-2607)]|nr:hypothetical protein V496_02151 [Pseudogymnoascus sp. VKM F-4515 (FW-2607)]
MKQHGKRKREDNPDVEQQAHKSSQTQGGHDHDPDLHFFTYSTNKYDLFERAVERKSVPELPPPKNPWNPCGISVLLVFTKDPRGENMLLQGYVSLQSSN